MLEVENLGCVRGERRLFSNLNFLLTPGTLLQVQGPNGSGKTSLLRLLCGLNKPEEGKIRWQGADIHSLGEEYFTAVTYVGHRNGVKEELTPLENLTFSSGLSGREINRDEASSILERMGLGGGVNLPARLLSEGQRRRTALARLLSSRTKLWLLDELLTSLDKTAVALAKAVVEDHLSKRGVAVVATHQELNLSAGSFQRLELAP